MLEAAPEDIVYENGKACVKGSPDAVKTIQDIALQAHVAYDLPAGHGAVPRGGDLLRSAELHLPVRHARLRGRGRSGHGRGRDRQVRRGRRRRQRHQPDDRRRPAPRRHRPGHRPGAVRGRGLRRQRRADHGDDERLRDPEGEHAADLRARPDGHAAPTSTRWAPRAPARPARSPRPRPSPTRSSTRSRTWGCKHIDMPYTPERVWRAALHADQATPIGRPRAIEDDAD